jgi:hypothetical protein
MTDSDSTIRVTAPPVRLVARSLHTLGRPTDTLHRNRNLREQSARDGPVDRARCEGF